MKLKNSMKNIYCFKIISVVLIAVMSFLMLSCSPKTVEDKKTEQPLVRNIRGVWITNVASDALFSLDKIKETVQVCKQSSITDIYVVVWNKGRTLYPSKIMENLIGIPIIEPFAGRDPLNEIIKEAHKEGIKVHAWFEFGFAASNGEFGKEILEARPEWKAMDVEGNLVSKNGFLWMNSFHPDVQQFIKSLIVEVVDNYDVDGIQGDDRLPALPSTGGYDEYTINMYKAEHDGQSPPSDYKDADWITWRADKLTDFLGELYTDLKSKNSQLEISMAPSVHPWAKQEYLQDWPTWLEKEYCDYVIPQIYRYDIEKYTATLNEQLEYLSPLHKDRLFAGVLLQVNGQNPSLEFLDQMIRANRQNGIKGEVFFFYEGLKKHTEYFMNEYNKK